MAVQPFPLADTFVAFMDIAGFKSMMGNGMRGVLALDAFYSAGFTVLKELRLRSDGSALVDGFFVSDCGVLFVRGQDQACLARLESLCRVIQQIHRRTFDEAVQLTTSIAWGEFSYDERIEFPGVGKSPLYGNAYVAAVSDNQTRSPKLYPSECRLIRQGLPPEVIVACRDMQGAIFKRMRSEGKHFYFDWMKRQNPRR
jgi:hypothetical protein